MAAAVAQQQYTWRALQARASVQAMGQEGNVDRMVNDYARQLGDQMVLEEINGIRDRQYSRAQAERVAQYMSRWNSQTFYNKTPVMDPVMPFFAIADVDHSTTAEQDYRAPPSNAAFAAQIGSSLLGGLAQGCSTYGTLNALKKPREQRPWHPWCWRGRGHCCPALSTPQPCHLLSHG